MALPQKKILMISPFFYPHLGGVEKHVLQVSNRLLLEDYQVEVITSAHQQKFVSVENIFGIQVNRKGIVDAINGTEVQIVDVLHLYVLFFEIRPSVSCQIIVEREFDLLTYLE
ncbi:MAG: Uncharacterized protein XD95_0458 [Microgenomates bacterium 39_7]|nr:MAG: Uncharacterized protein XD95_0458 [Microgenomates bacterium 39_7]